MKKEKSFFAKQVKKIMIEKGFTQQELANKIGVTQTMISHWLTGDSLPTMTSLQKFAEALDVSISYFLEEKSNTPAKNNELNFKTMDEKDIKILIDGKNIEILELKNKVLQLENEILKLRKR